MDFKKTGELLKSLRKARGITQGEVADALYVTQKTVSRWETGEGIPDITIIGTVANYYDITVDELLNGEIKKENQSEFTVKTKEQKKGKLVFRSINNKLTIFLSISMGVGALFVLLDLFISLFVNTVVGSILGVIGIIATLLIYLIGYQNIKNNYSDADVELSEKEQEKINKLFNRKNMLFYELFALIFLSTSILYFIFLYVDQIIVSLDYTLKEKIFFDAVYLIILTSFYFVFRKNIKTGSNSYKELKPKLFALSATLAAFSILALLNVRWKPEPYGDYLIGHYNSFLLFAPKTYGYVFRVTGLVLMIAIIIGLVLFAKFKNNTGILVLFVLGFIASFIASLDVYLIESSYTISGNYTAIVTTLVTLILIIVIYIKNHQMKLIQE